MKRPSIEIPDGVGEVLLHACCAPCSSAIVEWMLAHGVRPTIFYFNPNIWPREEYDIRKQESKRHAEGLGIRWIDGDYDHEAWRGSVCGLEGEPERGRRCQQCFTLRLTAAAQKAKEIGIRHFTTTLASSRWKSLEQINQAGHAAQQAVPGTVFWNQNWRKGGLQERRNQLLKEYQFYNQQYCGCEFSAKGAMGSGTSAPPTPSKTELRQQMREAKNRHSERLAEMSQEIVVQLRQRLKPSDAKTIMAFWPLPDEVDIRPLLDELVANGKTVLLPCVLDDSQMTFRPYLSQDDLHERAFHILEPTSQGDCPPVRSDLTGGLSPCEVGGLSPCEVALVPGVAFDSAGHRLGRGKGYYDRYLSEHPDIFKIGVCFPFQRVARVPAEKHDVRMDEVI